MQKIYVTLVMQSLGQEFWEKLMSFWLLHVISSCAWKAAPSAVEEEPGRVGWRFFPSCGGWAGAGAHPAFPCSWGNLGRPEAAGRPRWMWAEGKGGDSSKTEWFSEFLLSPQQYRWVLLILCFSLLLTRGRLCLPWVTALGPRCEASGTLWVLVSPSGGRCPVPCCPPWEQSPSSLPCVSKEEEGVPQEGTKLISWEVCRSSPVSCPGSIGATFNSAKRQVRGPGWPVVLLQQWPLARTEDSKCSLSGTEKAPNPKSDHFHKQACSTIWQHVGQLSSLSWLGDPGSNRTR